MSVIASNDVWTYRAPVSLGAGHASTTGSWEFIFHTSVTEFRMSPLFKSHLRLSTWKQQLRTCIAECCVDWTYYDNKPYVYLRFIAPNEISSKDVDLISDKVVSMIQNNPLLFKLQTIFQQEQPGPGVCSGNDGSEGSEGDNHAR